MTDKNRILHKEQIAIKLVRIAYQILEANGTEQELFLLGIRETGTIIADRIKQEIVRLAPDVQVNIIHVTINKQNPLAAEVQYSVPVEILQGKTIIITDDVGNTGKTLFYALQPLLHIIPKKVQIAVLIDRQHKCFPVHADFVGMSLATTIQEHIEVVLQQDDESVYLR